MHLTNHKICLESKSTTIHVQDETWWDGQHDRCKVQSHYTPNKGWQMKPICTHLFHRPTSTALRCKDYPQLCHDWFSWFSPWSNKRIRGSISPPALYHKEFRNCQICQDFHVEVLFYTAVCSYMCSLHPLSLNLLIQGREARCDSHLWWRKKTPGH